MTADEMRRLVEKYNYELCHQDIDYINTKIIEKASAGFEVYHYEMPIKNLDKRNYIIKYYQTCGFEVSQHASNDTTIIIAISWRRD